MGHCHSLDVQKVSFLDELAEVNDVIKSSEMCCAATRVPPEECPGAVDMSPHCAKSVLTQKGFIICVDSIDSLLNELPYELDADLDHLHALPEASAVSSSDLPFETPNFRRDVGTACRRLGGEGETGRENQDNFACLQIDDLANPWGLYVVSDGHGPHGQLVSTLLVHEVPGLLVQNPSIHRDSDLALYQSFVSAAEMATSCQFVDASVSGATLSAMLLRDGYLHVAWVGDAKIVLGRLVTENDRRSHSTLLETRSMSSSSSSAKKCPSAPAFPTSQSDFASEVVRQGTAAKRQGQASGPCQLLFRAVEITADHVVGRSCKSTSNPSEGSRNSGGHRRMQKVQSEGSNAEPVGAHATAVHAHRSHLGVPRGLTRTIGHSSLQCSNGEGKDSWLTSKPDVRRLRIKPDDMFVVLGTSGFWKWMTPMEAIAIVGECICQPAWRAVDALVTEVQKRSNALAPPDDLTVVVVYLAGERYVREGGHDVGMNDPSFEILREVRDHFAGCGCMTHIAGSSVTEPTPGKQADVGLVHLHAPLTGLH